MWVSAAKYDAIIGHLAGLEVKNQVLLEELDALRGSLSDLHGKVDALSKTKNLDNASYELKEFLADVMEHGCGIVKIAPDSIFIRGLRK